jgi:hypothetical protein
LGWPVINFRAVSIAVMVKSHGKEHLRKVEEEKRRQNKVLENSDS